MNTFIKDETYYFHQMPEKLAIDLIKTIPLMEGDRVVDTFKGEGSFYNNFPDFVVKDWVEIVEGVDYKDYTEEIDWVITNPPFKLQQISNKKRVTSFYPLLEYYAGKVHKGIAFLGNDYYFSTLTPIRMKKLNELGLYFQGYTICNVKKSKGRYFFMIFTKEKNNAINYLLESY